VANKKQRLKNTVTANRLKAGLPPTVRCPECNELTKTGHWVFGTLNGGFWVCRKFYGPDGRRLVSVFS
jgi:transcription elongation factor Elf1